MTQITLFDYDSLSPDLQVEVKSATERIKLRMKRTAEDIIEIGKDLIAIKEKLPHGQFLPWIATEFEMSEDTAGRFMSVASRFPDIPQFAEFKPSLLYILAAPSTPDEVVEQVIERAENGESVTVKEVKELKATIANLKQANQLASTKLKEQQALMQSIESTMQDNARSLAEKMAEVKVREATESLRLELTQLKAEKIRLESQQGVAEAKVKDAEAKYAKALADFKANPDPETQRAINEAKKSLEDLQGKRNILLSEIDNAQQRIEQVKEISEERAANVLVISSFFNAIDKAFANHSRIGAAIVSPYIDDAHIERFKEIMNAFYEYGNLIQQALDGRNSLPVGVVDVQVVEDDF